MVALCIERLFRLFPAKFIDRLMITSISVGEPSPGAAVLSPGWARRTLTRRRSVAALAPAIPALDLGVNRVGWHAGIVAGSRRVGGAPRVRTGKDRAGGSPELAVEGRPVRPDLRAARVVRIRVARGHGAPGWSSQETSHRLGRNRSGQDAAQQQPERHRRRNASAAHLYPGAASPLLHRNLRSPGHIMSPVLCPVVGGRMGIVGGTWTTVSWPLSGVEPR